MSTAPRTDSFLKRPDTAWDAMWIEHARTLERELTAEREKVRVLREALEKYHHTIIAGGTNPALAALAATEAKA